MKHDRMGVIIFRVVIMLLLCGIGFLYGTAKRNTPCKGCNIVIISVDTIRADELSCYGYKYNTTPNLCRFADNNLRFSNAFSQSTWTLPNEVSLFSSLYQSNHHIDDRLSDMMHPGIKTLPQVYKEAGYHTVFVGNPREENLPLHSGMIQYFDTIIPTDNNSVREEVNTWTKTMQSLAERKPGSPPVFVYIYSSFVHNYIDDFPVTTPFRFDPAFTPPEIPDLLTFTGNTLIDAKFELRHRIYTNNEPEKLQIYQKILTLLESANTLSEAKRIFETLPERVQKFIYITQLYSLLDEDNPKHSTYARNTYDNRLNTLDTQMNRFLDVVDHSSIAQTTITLFLSDHGENLGDHGFGHVREPTDSLTHVPLLLHIPKTSPKTITDIVQLVDIYPTLLQLTGIPYTQVTAGKNLLTKSSKQFAISELNDGRYQSIRTDTWRYTLLTATDDGYTEHLFHIPTDPMELRDVSEAYPKITSQLKKQMLSEIHRLPEYPVDRP